MAVVYFNIPSALARSHQLSNTALPRGPLRMYDEVDNRVSAGGLLHSDRTHTYMTFHFAFSCLHASSYHRTYVGFSAHCDALRCMHTVDAQPTL